MKCTNCGKKIKKSCGFCTKCGEPVRKSSIKIPVIASICTVLLLGGTGIGYHAYQNNITKQAGNVIAYFEDGDYDKAAELYEKYSHKKASFDNGVSEYLKGSAEQLKESYATDDIDYNAAIKQLLRYEAYDIRELDDITEEITQWIDMINISRDYYRDGKTCLDRGDYADAIEKLSVVLKEDEKYYTLAAEDIEKAVQGMTSTASHITSVYYSNTYTSEGKETMTISLELPVLEGDNPAYESINEVFDRLKDEYTELGKQKAEEASEYALEDYFNTYSLDMTYSVRYNQNGILCVMMEGYDYSGGAHGYPVREVLTFDLAAGTQLKLDDLITIDEAAFSSCVIDEFWRMYNNTPEEYWEDSPATVQNYSAHFDTINYYLSEDSICVFYYPYDLGSYARGFVEIYIQYTGNEAMFEFLQK